MTNSPGNSLKKRRLLSSLPGIATEKGLGDNELGTFKNV